MSQSQSPPDASIDASDVILHELPTIDDPSDTDRAIARVLLGEDCVGEDGPIPDIHGIVTPTIEIELPMWAITVGARKLATMDEPESIDLDHYLNDLFQPNLRFTHDGEPAADVIRRWSNGDTTD